MGSISLLRYQGYLLIVIIVRLLGQIVGNAIVAVDTGLAFCQGALMTFARVTVLFTEVHGFQ